jgi:hypothetical protein
MFLRLTRDAGFEQIEDLLQDFRLRLLNEGTVRVIGLRVIIINPTLANKINIDDLNPDLLTFEVGNILPSTVP